METRLITQEPNPISGAFFDLFGMPIIYISSFNLGGSLIDASLKHDAQSDWVFYHDEIKSSEVLDKSISSS